jgi:hypothetical protein
MEPWEVSDTEGEDAGFGFGVKVAGSEREIVARGAVSLANARAIVAAHNEKIRVRVGRGWKGRGVYAARAHAPDEVIEECHVLLLPSKELRGKLSYYCFQWSDEMSALLLGNGSLLNHSYAPNAYVLFDRRGTMASVVARSSIAAGDEILINYNGDPDATEKVAFYRPLRRTRKKR